MSHRQSSGVSLPFSGGNNGGASSAAAPPTARPMKMTVGLQMLKEELSNIREWCFFLPRGCAPAMFVNMLANIIYRFVTFSAHEEKTALAHVQRVNPALADDDHMMGFLRAEQFDVGVSSAYINCNFQFW